MWLLYSASVANINWVLRNEEDPELNSKVREITRVYDTARIARIGNAVRVKTVDKRITIEYPARFLDMLEEVAIEYLASNGTPYIDHKKACQMFNFTLQLCIERNMIDTTKLDVKYNDK